MALTTVTYSHSLTHVEPLPVTLPGSKSISNRLLMLDALAGLPSHPHCPAHCDDTRAMTDALTATAADHHHCEVNIGAAGTAMRFLTAFYAATAGCDILLDGSDRMRERPIAILVEALRSIGADITYAGHDGYPPLHIRGRQLKGGRVTIDGSVSSQYASALMMIAPVTTDGLELTITGNIVSRPYLMMTAALMRRYGASVAEHTPALGQYTMTIAPSRYSAPPVPMTAEGDWSAASYWYEIAAITSQSFRLETLQRRSLQGDALVASIFAPLGVDTVYNDDNSITISRRDDVDTSIPYEAWMQECPDLVQAVVVTCCALGRPFTLTGVSTLRIKETDRLEALKAELAKLGYDIGISGNDMLVWDGSRTDRPAATPLIATYNDHRMAMSIAPLAAVNGKLVIDNPNVVTKSYPQYWDHITRANYTTEP